MRPRSRDPRAVKARAALQDALLRELRNVDLHEVSVAQIHRSAGVARSTFYRHYGSLTALADDVVDTAADALAPRLPASGDGRRDAADRLVALVDHVTQHEALARSLFGSGHAVVLVDRMTARLAGDLAQDLASDADADAGSVEAAILAGAAIGGITAWLRTPGADPDELRRRLAAIVAAGAA